MAIVMIQEFGGSIGDYDKLAEKLDSQNNPPDGLIVHSAIDLGNAVRIVDVWQTEDQWDAFVEQRLGPAILEVLGPDAPDATEPEIRPVHNLVKP